MKLLSFYGGHDASVAGFDGKKTYYLKYERESGVKHNHPAKRQDIVDLIENCCKKWGFRPDAIAYSNTQYFFDSTKDSNTLWEQVSFIDL